MWEGTGGVGEAIGRRVQTLQEHGSPQAGAWRAWKAILTPAAVQVEDSLNRHWVSPCRAEVTGGAGWGSAGTGPAGRAGSMMPPHRRDKSVGRRWKAGEL